MIVIVINFKLKKNTISYNKSADINKTIKTKLNKKFLHAVFDPSTVGTPWLVSVSTDILESASVGIPGPASVGIMSLNQSAWASPNQFAWVSLNTVAQ